MTINIEPKDTILFEKNGYTQEDVGKTINHYREQGISDNEIQLKINEQINHLSQETTPITDVNMQNTPRTGVPRLQQWALDGDTNIEKLKQTGQLKLQKRINYEKEHPIKSEFQKSFQPMYRSERLRMEQQAKYGAPFRAPIGEMLTQPIKEAGQEFIPSLNIALALATQGKSIPAQLREKALVGAGEGAIQGGVERGLADIGDNGLSLRTLGEIGKGASAGGLVGAGLPVLGRGVQKIYLPVRKGMNEVPKKFEQYLPAISEFFHSIPRKYGKIALDAEKNGNSIFKEKFNENSYHPVENKIRQAREAIDNNSYYNEEYKNMAQNVNNKMQDNIISEDVIGQKYYKVGQKVVEGLENVKSQSEEAINQALNNLPSEYNVDTKELLTDLTKMVRGYARGGSINPATFRAKKEIALIYNLLGKKTEDGLAPKFLKPIDIHNIKELLYDMADYETPQGIRNKTLKDMARNMNEKLRSMSSEYAAANDKYALYKKLEKEAGGINQTTIASKLSKMNEKNSQMSGFNENIRKVNNILPNENKFLQDIYELENLKSSQQILRKNIGNIKSMSIYDDPRISIETKKTLDNLYPEEVEKYLTFREKQLNENEILKRIGNKYERNPRLLSNISDQEGQTLLQDLQDKSKIQFMDELERVRAQEMYSKWFTGQGGGSGGTQGMGNIVRAGFLGTSFGKFGIFGAIPTYLAMSPRFGGKGLIKMADKLIKLEGKTAKLPKTISSLDKYIAPIIRPMAGIPLQGKIEYNEYR